MIVWLASYPRSGNTFFRVLLNHLYSIRTLSTYNDIIFEEQPSIGDIVGHVHNDRTIDDLAKSEDTVIVKTHDLPRGDAFPAMYLVRDGRDALVSYARFILSFEQHNPHEGYGRYLKILHDLIVYQESFGGWSRNVCAWTMNHQAPVAVVRFEDLIQTPASTVHTALTQAGWPVPQPDSTLAIPSFDELHSRMPEFFRKGQIGSWRDEMPWDLQELFWDHHGSVMEQLGYAA